MKKSYKKPVIQAYDVNKSPLLSASDINDQMGDQNQLAKPYDFNFVEGED